MDRLESSFKDHAKGNEFSSMLAQSFLNDCLSAALINFHTGKAWVLKCDLWPELLGQEYEWHELVQRYIQKRIFTKEDERSTLALELENIKTSCLQEGRKVLIETRITCDEGVLKWVEITVTVADLDKNMAIVRICDIDEAILMRKIVDLFVYQNYDYLLLIDSKKDSYLRFTGGKGSTPLPPERGDSYTQDMMCYNKLYVMPEDCQRITDNMQLSNVIQMLEKKDTYSFTSNGITMDGCYRQSRVTFIYSDKLAGLILCARTDVTQIYLEEQEKNQKLAEALRNAQNDPMTGIYNKKATAELVAHSLKTRYRNMATVFFIDVDNFKMLNDTYGHQKGDEFLQFMAQQLREIAGRDGIAGRLGGDEFLLYLSSMRSQRKIEEIGQSVCQIFNSFPAGFADKTLLSCSVGISLYPQDGIDYETLVRKADQALYTSKRYGKNQYHFFSCQEERC